MLQLKVLMVRREQAGFTLIEIIFVLAISSIMFTSILVGERYLRSRAQFDANVNRTVSSASEARNQANSAVNVLGDGTGTAKCSSASAPNPSGVPPYQEYVYVGTEWELSSGSPIIKQRSWKAVPGSFACSYSSTTVDIPTNMTVTAPGPNGGRALFIRDDTGKMHTCLVADTTTDVSAAFAGGSCPSALTTLQFTVADNQGHSANIVIDSTGLARRN